MGRAPYPSGQSPHPSSGADPAGICGAGPASLSEAEPHRQMWGMPPHTPLAGKPRKHLRGGPRVPGRAELYRHLAGAAPPRPALLFACAKSNQKAHEGEKTYGFLPFVPLFPLTGKSLRRHTLFRSLVPVSTLILSTRTESFVFLGKPLHYAYSVSVGPDFLYLLRRNCSMLSNTVGKFDVTPETHPVGR